VCPAMAHPDSRTDALAGGVTAQRNYFDVIFTDTERHVVVLEGAVPFTVLIRELVTYEWTREVHMGSSSGAKARTLSDTLRHD
jgi:hypothetical protein